MMENDNVYYECRVTSHTIFGNGSCSDFSTTIVSEKTLDALYEELARHKIWDSSCTGKERVEMTFGPIRQIKLIGQSNVSTAIINNTKIWKDYLAGNLTFDDEYSGV